MLVDLRPNGNPLPHRTPRGDDFCPDLPLLFKLHEIWLVAFLKIVKIVATRCRPKILRLKCTKFDLGLGSAPDPAAAAYSAPQDTLAGFKGAYFSANLFSLLLTHVALYRPTSALEA